jgi:ribosome-associated heat shock protein Hsp15
LQEGRQRVDRWLWNARVVRTRVLAARLAASGHVRVNGQRIDAPGRALRVGDVLTIALSARVKVLRVLAFAERRGGAEQASRLYDDLSPPPEPAPSLLASPRRDPGAGRPTKRERRAVERVRQRSADEEG